MKAEWARLESQWDIPYFPHISVGWDNNPRFNGIREGIVKNSPPETVKEALLMARAYADAHPSSRP